MLQNPIAFLFLRPRRLLFVALALIAGYVATGVTLDVDDATVCDASEVSRVELLR
jgi:hypothetical protein